MHYLNPFLIIQILFLLLMIISVVTLILYLGIRLRQTFSLRLFQVFLFFLGTGFIFTYLNKISLLNNSDSFFYLASIVCFMISSVFAITSIVHIWANRKKEDSALYLPPDMAVILSKMKDLALVYNDNFDLVAINHPELIGSTLPAKTTSTLYNLVEELRKRNEIIDEHSKWLLNHNDCAEMLKSSFNCEIRINSPEKQNNEQNQSDMFFLISSSPVHDRHKQSLGVVLLFHDITHEKRLQKQLADSNKALEFSFEKLSEKIQIEQKLQLEKEKLNLITVVQNDLADQLSITITAINDSICNRSVQSKNFVPKTNSESGEYNQLISDDYIKSLSADLRSIYKKVRQTVKEMNRNT